MREDRQNRTVEGALSNGGGEGKGDGRYRSANTPTRKNRKERNTLSVFRPSNEKSPANRAF